MCGKKFSIYGVHFPPKCVACTFFTDAPVPHLKLQVEFFKNFFPQKTEKAMICSIKIQSKNMKMTWNISLFPFGMIVNFVSVMALQFWK